MKNIIFKMVDVNAEHFNATLTLFSTSDDMENNARKKIQHEEWIAE